MGSYLSIVNDTPDAWRCKVGPDEEALRVSGVIITVVGAIATAIGTVGGAAPIVAGLTASGVVAVLGVPTSALVAITTGVASAAAYASVIGGVSGFSMSVAEAIATVLERQGFETIVSGQSHRWGKMTLSQWQQGTCVKSVLVNEKTVRVETLYMRPIFSGATKDSNNDHRIQWWINKWGTEKQDIEAHEGGKRLLMAEDEQVTAANDNGAVSPSGGESGLPPTDKLFYFYDNGTSTYNN